MKKWKRKHRTSTALTRKTTVLPRANKPRPSRPCPTRPPTSAFRFSHYSSYLLCWKRLHHTGLPTCSLARTLLRSRSPPRSVMADSGQHPIHMKPTTITKHEYSYHALSFLTEPLQRVKRDNRP